MRDSLLIIHTWCDTVPTMELIVSLFPGAGLMDYGFSLAGYSVLRGPDTLLGGDIRTLTLPARSVTGIIGGPPCQDYSRARRHPPTGYGDRMVKEFGRLVQEGQPSWWLMECVPGVPTLSLPGYVTQRFNIYASDFGLPHRRNRSFQFGSKGTKITVPRGTQSHLVKPTPLASQAVGSFRQRCRDMGLPDTYDLPGLTRAAKFRAVGNGVAVPVAYAIACAIRDRSHTPGGTQCPCECGRLLTGQQQAATAACRKRLQRLRQGDTPRVIEF